jgi:hypothetical protein
MLNPTISKTISGLIFSLPSLSLTTSVLQFVMIYFIVGMKYIFIIMGSGLIHDWYPIYVNVGVEGKTSHYKGSNFRENVY